MGTDDVSRFQENRTICFQVSGHYCVIQHDKAQQSPPSRDVQTLTMCLEEMRIRQMMRHEGKLWIVHLNAGNKPWTKFIVSALSHARVHKKQQTS